MQYDTDGSGSLELEEFKNVVKKALKIEGRVCFSIGKLLFFASKFYFK